MRTIFYIPGYLFYIVKYNTLTIYKNMIFSIKTEIHSSFLLYIITDGVLHFEDKFKSAESNNKYIN